MKCNNRHKVLFVLISCPTQICIVPCVIFFHRTIFKHSDFEILSYLIVVLNFLYLNPLMPGGNKNVTHI